LLDMYIASKKSSCFLIYLYIMYDGVAIMFLINNKNEIKIIIKNIINFNGILYKNN
jgi:hypothetical protein